MVIKYFDYKRHSLINVGCMCSTIFTLLVLIFFGIFSRDSFGDLFLVLSKLDTVEEISIHALSTRNFVAVATSSPSLVREAFE